MAFIAFKYLSTERLESSGIHMLILGESYGKIPTYLNLEVGFKPGTLVGQGYIYKTALTRAIYSTTRAHFLNV